MVSVAIKNKRSFLYLFFCIILWLVNLLLPDVKCERIQHGSGSNSTIKSRYRANLICSTIPRFFEISDSLGLLTLNTEIDSSIV